MTGRAPPRAGATGTLARLAWRNLWRQRRRTLLLVVAVGYATLAIVFFWGFIDGFLNSILAAQGRLIAAPVAITTEAYHEDPDPSHALGPLGAIESAALSDPRVRHVAPRVEFGALLRSPYTSEGSMARGIDPQVEGTVSELPQHVTNGRMLHAPGEIVLGAGLAERLDTRLGERVAVDVSALNGPQALGLTLVGTIDSGTPSVDDSTALVHIDDARRLTGVATATALALDAPRGKEEAVAAALQRVMPNGTHAYPVQALMGELVRTLGIARVEAAVLGLVFSLFGAVTVTSTVVVSVMERTREFGMMVALGLDQPRLAYLVTLESILATTLGWLVGAAAGFGLLWLFSVWNVFGPLFAGLYGDLLSGISLPTVLTTSVRPEYLLYASVTIALAAAFAVLAPARRVRNLRPAEAMRSE